MRSRFSFVVAGCLWLHLQQASAATTQVSLSVTGCDAAGIAADRLFELARTELAPRPLAVETGASEAGTLRAAILLCQGSPQRALLTIEGSGTLRLERRVDLADVTGDLRARTLAGAFAEFVASAEAWPPASSVPENDPVSTRPSGAPGDPPQRMEVGAALSHTAAARPPFQQPPLPTEPDATRLGAGLAARLYFAPRTSLAGPWLAFTSGAWHGEVLFLASSVDHQPQGKVTLYDLNLAAGYRVIRLRRSPEVALRVRGELGWGWAKGISSRPADVRASSGSTWQAALLLELPARFSVSQHVSVLTRAEGGATRGLTAQVDDQAVATTQGLFAGVAIGIHWELQ